MITHPRPQIRNQASTGIANEAQQLDTYESEPKPKRARVKYVAPSRDGGRPHVAEAPWARVDARLGIGEGRGRGFSRVVEMSGDDKAEEEEGETEDVEGVERRDTKEEEERRQVAARGLLLMSAAGVGWRGLV